ncbi:MAG: sulfite exporter TauE/SafE family protein [Egibacteraceae bacterium]
MTARRTPFTLLVGLVVGLVSGMFGIGGGAFITLGLLALGFSQHAAHATSLAAIILIAAAAAVPYALDGSVAGGASLLLAAAAMLGAYLGAGLMSRFSGRRLRLIFIVFLLATAVTMLFGLDPTELDTDSAFPALTPVIALLIAALGLLAGALSSVLGIGGGLVMIPGMVLLFGFSQHAAEGTSLAVVVPTAIVGALRHSRTGYTDWKAGLLVGLGGILGGVGGANVALALEEALLRRLFGGFLVVMALQLWRAGRAERKRPADEVAAAAER